MSLNPRRVTSIGMLGVLLILPFLTTGGGNPSTTPVNTCSLTFSMSGTTPIAANASFTKTGTPGQDFATFINPLLATNKQYCLNPGIFAVSSAISIPKRTSYTSGFTLRGAGAGVTQITANAPGADILDIVDDGTFQNNGVYGGTYLFQDMTLNSTGGRTTGKGIAIVGSANTLVSRMIIENQATGYDVEPVNGAIMALNNIEDTTIENFCNDGMLLHGSTFDFYDRILLENPEGIPLWCNHPANGIEMDASIAPNQIMDDFRFLAVHSEGGPGVNYPLILKGSGIISHLNFVNSAFDTALIDNIHVESTLRSFYMSNGIINGATRYGFYMNSTLTNTSIKIAIINSEIHANGNAGMIFDGVNTDGVSISDSQVTTSGQFTSADGLRILGGTNFKISGNLIGANNGTILGFGNGVFVGANMAGYVIANNNIGPFFGIPNGGWGINIASTTAGDFVIANNRIAASGSGNLLGAIVDQSTGLNQTINNNPGYNPIAHEPTPFLNANSLIPDSIGVNALPANNTLLTVTGSPKLIIITIGTYLLTHRFQVLIDGTSIISVVLPVLNSVYEFSLTAGETFQCLYEGGGRTVFNVSGQ